MERKAVVAGATGLVGRELLDLLLNRKEYVSVTALVRRRMPMEHPRLRQMVVDYSKLEKLPEELIRDSDVFCTLGTTRRKAGSKRQFEIVDHDYPMALGRLAVRHGAARMLIITALGANESSLFFYSKVKGRVEKGLQSLGLRRLYIFRPSLILGKREERRAGEEAAAWISARLPFLFSGPLSRYKPIAGREIAEGMLGTALTSEDAVAVIPSHEISAQARVLRESS